MNTQIFTYNSPQIEIVEIEVEQAILTGSDTNFDVSDGGL